MDKVGRSVDGINDPRWLGRQLVLVAGGVRLFADELVIGVLCAQLLSDELLDGLVGLCDELERERGRTTSARGGGRLKAAERTHVGRVLLLVDTDLVGESVSRAILDELAGLRSARERELRVSFGSEGVCLLRVPSRGASQKREGKRTSFARSMANSRMEGRSSDSSVWDDMFLGKKLERGGDGAEETKSGLQREDAARCIHTRLVVESYAFDRVDGQGRACLWRGRARCTNNATSTPSPSSNSSPSTQDWLLCTSSDTSLPPLQSLWKHLHLISPSTETHPSPSTPRPLFKRPASPSSFLRINSCRHPLRSPF